MSLKQKLMGERRGPGIGAAITVILGLCFLMTPLGEWLRLRSYDLLFLVRPSTEPAALDEVVILSMDEESQGKLKQDPDRPWNRVVHTRLLKELTARGAKLVVFDVLWNEPSTDPLVDEELAAAIREHGRVVLAAHWRWLGNEGLSSQKVVPPANPIRTNAPWGLVEWPIHPGSSPVIRRQFYHPSHPNMPWQAAAALGRAPPERALSYWLNYYGPRGTLHTISYHQAFESNALPSNFFAGKTVFVGKAPVITAQGQTSEAFPTPYSLWPGGLTSGVEIEATAFLNLIRREWLEEISPAPGLLLVLMCGLVFGWGLSLVRPWKAGALALAGIVLVAAGSGLLTWWLHRWYPWLVLCAAQIPCALACAALTHTKRVEREKDTLQREVALAESVARLPQGGSGASPGTTGVTVRDDATTAPPFIPNHQLLQRIGRGSYGEVWLARDDIGTYHAAKVVYRRSFGSADPYEREFRGLQKFTPISRSHPGFVHILHVGRNDAEGCFFYVMELGDDEQKGQRIDPAAYSSNTLARQLEKRKRIPLREAVQLGIDLAGALDYLHQERLIHRDIKPSNIIFVKGAPKFADVGLVTDLASTGKSATFLGTEGYIAPEGPGTAAADVFSLGKVLYEAGTGRDRLDFPALPATLVNETGDDLARFNDLILKACEPDPRRRFSTAAELRTRLVEIEKRFVGAG